MGQIRNFYGEDLGGTWGRCANDSHESDMNVTDSVEIDNKTSVVVQHVTYIKKNANVVTREWQSLHFQHNGSA